jgi:hypothetical protein
VAAAIPGDLTGPGRNNRTTPQQRDVIVHWELVPQAQGFGGTTEIQKEIISRGLGL